MSGIYLHWPFCLSRCAYCDFVSGTDFSLMNAYAGALRTEMPAAARLLSGPVDTVFWGGGTPSTCPPPLLTDVFRDLRSSFAMAPDAEITVEMNPRTAAPGWLEAACAAGVNRVSMGLQAVQQRHLRLLGRHHTAAEFEEAFNGVRGAGFDNISIDLIYGLPGQTMAEWLETLQFAADIGPEHISCYALSVEEGTPLAAQIASGAAAQPDEDLAADMYILARSFLAGRGFAQYEISNFARPGRSCRHNLLYWTLQDYLGLGAGAHSMIGSARFANAADTTAYISALAGGLPAIAAWELRSAREMEREFFMLRTRLTAGFSAAEFEAISGRPLHDKDRPGLRQAQRDGLLLHGCGRYRPTGLGLRFQNRLAALLMADV